jgi:steroid delta-isomerase-like uncharacterized protein
MAENKEIVRRFIDEIFLKGNYDYLDEACSSDFVCHDSLEGVQDKEDYKRQFRKMSRAFPDLKGEFYEVFGEGNLFAARWRMQGEHKGDFQGLKASGKRFNVEGISMFKLENGKIAEEWDHYDALGWLQQLGAIEVPEELRQGKQAEARPQA